MVHEIVTAHFETVDEECGKAMDMGAKLCHYGESKLIIPIITDFLQEYSHSGTTIEDMDKIIDENEADVVILIYFNNTLHLYPVIETD